MIPVEILVEELATLSAALFTGAAVYVNLVEHPSRMSLGPAAALAEWGPSYIHATRMQAPLAAVGALAAVAAWLTGGGIAWLIGGILLGAVVPFTLVVILPINKRLLDPLATRDPVLTSRLLNHWNRLHAVRSLLSLAALVLFIRNVT